MKTMIKVIVVLVVLLVLGVVGVLVYGLTHIDDIAKAAVERGGTYAMQVDTTVDTVSVSLGSGKATMNGLRIANPTGFKTDHFFTLTDTSASIDLGSVRTDTVVMPEIRLSGIDVILDKGNKPSNYNKILENLKRFESGDAPAPTDKKGKAGKEGKKMVIKSLVLEDINIHVANMPGISLAVGDVAVHIPEITLENVGEKDAMTPAQIFDLVIKTVLAAAVDAGGGIIPADVLGELGKGLSGLTSLSELGIDAITDLDIEGALGGITDTLNEQGEEIKKQGEEIINKVDDASKDIQKKLDEKADDLKNLFGGKKKDGP